ncbi:hypothetical protein LZ31DRAFT_615700 [Colletotrichum somersetense]|nr:hypothetical protein LZ31DRAFT_615700 [Colletotrichum somersetense]
MAEPRGSLFGRSSPPGPLRTTATQDQRVTLAANIPTPQRRGFQVHRGELFPIREGHIASSILPHAATAVSTKTSVAMESEPGKHQLMDAPTITDSRPLKAKPDDCCLSMLVTCPQSIGRWPRIKGPVAATFATAVPYAGSLYAADSLNTCNYNQCNHSLHEVYMNIQQPVSDPNMSKCYPSQETMNAENVFRVWSETTPNGSCTVHFQELKSPIFCSNDQETLWSFPTTLGTVADEPSTDATVPGFELADKEVLLRPNNNAPGPDVTCSSEIIHPGSAEYEIVRSRMHTKGIRQSSGLSEAPSLPLASITNPGRSAKTLSPTSPEDSLLTHRQNVTRMFSQSLGDEEATDDEVPSNPAFYVDFDYLPSDLL